MVRLSPESTWFGAAGALVLVGFGLGLTVAPMLIAAQNAVPKIRMGAATSLSQFSRSMTGAITVAIMGAIIAGTLSAQRPEGPNIPSPNEVVDPIKRDSLTEEQRDAWKGPLSDGLTRAFFVGIVAAALGFISALAIPRGKAEDFVSSDSNKPENPTRKD
jgi:MFS family permease